MNRDHLYEIFSVYGSVKNVDLPLQDNRGNSVMSRGYSYIDFEKAEDAENAMKHMDGGQIDGQEVTASPILALRQQLPMRRRSPMPMMQRRGPLPRRRSPLRMRRWSPPPMRRRSPMPRRRSRSRTPPRRRRYSRSSSSSSR